MPWLMGHPAQPPLPTTKKNLDIPLTGAEHHTSQLQPTPASSPLTTSVPVCHPATLPSLHCTMMRREDRKLRNATTTATTPTLQADNPTTASSTTSQPADPTTSTITTTMLGPEPSTGTPKPPAPPVADPAVPGDPKPRPAHQVMLMRW